MHYYQFRINDYVGSTQHLDELEDLAYRRMLDLYYHKESPLPADVDQIARLIRMRPHKDRIEIVLQEFFVLEADGYHNDSADSQLKAIYDKSEKAKKSAEARWAKRNANASKTNANASKDDANAMQTQCETDADGMLPNNPLPNNTVTKDLLSDKSDAVEVLKHLNKVTGQNFKMTTQSHLSAINARIKDGATVEDCKTVIEFKYNQWKGTEQIQYMRPSTLFRPSNFDGYLLAAKSNVKPTSRDVNAIGSDFSKPKGWN